MFIAYLQTAGGQMTLGLVDISRAELEGPRQPLDALVNALAAVRAPLVLTSTNTLMAEAPVGTPATMTFKYLGTRSVEFSSETAFYESANGFLERNVYECPHSLKLAVDGTFTAQCEYFQLIDEEPALGAEPTVMH